MFKNLFIAAMGLCTLAQAETTITGAGASFPAPVYQKWTYAYSQHNPGTQVTYQSMGSGAGLNQIKAGTVDFAGSDNPLTLEQQEEAGLEQYPMLTGGVVVIVNLPGVKNNQLKLSQNVLSRIFLGEITSWNDPAIRSTHWLNGRFSHSGDSVISNATAKASGIARASDKPVVNRMPSMEGSAP